MSSSVLANLLKHNSLRVPWPVHVAGLTQPGDLGINRICETKCSLRPCLQGNSTSIGTACHLGLTVYEIAIGSEKVKVFGVVGSSSKDKLPKHQDFKTACKGRSVSPADVQNWANAVRGLLKEFDDIQKNALATALEPLHDAMRLARDVSQLADGVINEGNGSSAGEKFDNATQTQKALVKSAKLLEDTFDLLEVYLNPEAARFGQLRSIEVYKLLDKLCRIASIARSSQTRPRVRLEGSTRRSYDLYETFKLIPFCLIDNAQKYSRQNAEVVVSVVEEQSGLVVSIRSEGPYIDPIEHRNIFERGYRAAAAVAAHPSGMGVGLFVSDIVARAHGTRITVTSQKLEFQIGGIEQGINTFAIRVKSVISKHY
jgi:hypothetical protein